MEIRDYINLMCELCKNNKNCNKSFILKEKNMELETISCNKYIYKIKNK